MLCDDFITIYHGRGNGLHGIFAIRAVPLFGHTLHLAALVLLTFHFLFFLGKSTKLFPQELLFLFQIRAKSFVDWGAPGLPNWFSGGVQGE